MENSTQLYTCANMRIVYTWVKKSFKMCIYTLCYIDYTYQYNVLYVFLYIPIILKFVFYVTMGTWWINYCKQHLFRVWVFSVEYEKSFGTALGEIERARGPYRRQLSMRGARRPRMWTAWHGRRDRPAGKYRTETQKRMIYFKEKYFYRKNIIKHML